MLQIISGTFFGGGPINEREIDAILYSNYSWIAPISTRNIVVHPVDPYTSPVAGYTLRCTSRYESEPEDNATRRQASLVHPHAMPAIHQFRLLCCFYFRAFFHEDRHYVETLCRPQPRHSEDSIVPSRFIPRYFDLNVRGTSIEATDFPEFVDQVISMPRTRFKVFMSCLETFFDALESIGTNFDLAYSMFAYLLETLVKDGDTFTPQWVDYDRRTADKLDVVFSRLDDADASAIRTILLDESQLKLTQRFVKGVSSLTEDEFFLAESADRTNAVPRSQLTELLRNLYKTRSGYVHELRAAQNQLRVPAFSDEGASDVFVWDNEPFLTMSGLIRLAHHVLRTYLARQPKLPTETYPEWRSELPGIVMAKMAPRYWIWNHEQLSGKNAHSRFNGVIANFCDSFQTNTPVVDLCNVIAKIEDILGNIKLEQRYSLLGIYMLWNTAIVESGKSPNRERIFSRYSQELNECTIQIFAVHVILRDEPVLWGGHECALCLSKYQQQRYRADGVSLPRRLEIALTVETANRFRDVGDAENCRKWMRHALMDAGGLKDTQAEIERSLDSGIRLSTHSVMGFKVTEPEGPFEWTI